MSDDLRRALARTQSKPLREGLERTFANDADGKRPGPTFRAWKGPWLRELRYSPGDVVEHLGSSWRCLLRHRDSEPPSVKWELVAQKGQTGVGGARGFIGPTGPEGPPGPGSELEFLDEGVSQGTATVVDVTGPGASVSVAAGVATLNVPASGGGHVIEDEGVPLAQRPDLNFVGAGVVASDVAGVTVVTIPGGGSVAFDDPVESQFGDANAQGVDVDAARADHVHDRHDDAVMYFNLINA